MSAPTAPAPTSRTRGTLHLEEGDTVYTVDLGEEDFQIPLVAPTRGTVRSTVRTVKSVHGRVVRFTDGTKSRKLHGRTAWLLAEVRNG